MRAFAEESPIDPTEDAGQMRLLLGKIRGAIDGEKGTRRQLIRNAEDHRALNLHLTTPLPGSLGDLTWTINLKPLPAASLQHHLIKPLMSRVYGQRKQLDDLIGQLNAKDHIISKLLDKLEGSGMEITSIFPGAAAVRGSKHSTSREQAAQQVQGLGVFDRKKWLQDHISTLGSHVPHGKLPEVLDVPAPIDHIDDPKEADYQWLSALPSAIGESVYKEDIAAAAVDDADGDATMDEEDNGADEDIFERQDTPPRLKKSKPSRILPNATTRASRSQAAHQHSDETTDDDDLDGPSSRPQRRALATPEPTSSALSEAKKEASQLLPKPRRLGKLGGSVTTQSMGQNLGNNVNDPKDKGTGSETEDEDENDLDISKPPDSSLQPSLTAIEQPAGVPARRGKLGVLGGKKAAGSADGSASPTPAHQSSPEPARAPSRIRSKIGGKKATDLRKDEATGTRTTDAVERTESSSAVREQTTLARKEEPTTASSVPPESEQDRANRKREELRRELEKAQGPKKKRKF